jgi:hypothetical protein
MGVARPVAGKFIANYKEWTNIIPDIHVSAAEKRKTVWGGWK